MPVAASAEAPSAKAVDLEAVPVMGSKETSNCVAALLPKDAFKKTPDLEWVCKQGDPRDGASKLKVEVVKGAGGQVSDASKIFAKLGWYELAVYATVYAGCCAESKPLSLPDPAEGCGKMDKALQTLGVSVADGADSTEPLKAFGEVVACEAKANRANLFRQKGPPAASEAETFSEYVKAIQP